MLQFISMQEAFVAIEKEAYQLFISSVVVPLPDAVGHVLAKPVVAHLSIPPFNNSARDGFVLSRDGLHLASEGQALKISGELRAGDG